MPPRIDVGDGVCQRVLCTLRINDKWALLVKTSHHLNNRSRPIWKRPPPPLGRCVDVLIPPASVPWFWRAGSFVGRSSATAGRASFTAASTAGTRKDLDLRRPISLSEADCTALTRQLTRDTEFLEQWGLMDYSLILAIHNCPPGTTPPGTEGGTKGSTIAGATVTSSDTDDGWWNCAYVGGGTHGAGTVPMGDGLCGRCT